MLILADTIIFLVIKLIEIQLLGSLNCDLSYLNLFLFFLAIK